MSDKPKRDYGLILAIVFICLGILLVFFPFNIINGFTICNFRFETEDYDKLGDFINGVTTPFFSISAFILLYMTYRSQKEELVQTREVLNAQSTTLDKQQFETTFFNLLNLHHQIVNNIDLRPMTSPFPTKTIKPIDPIKTGRDCFVTFYRGITSMYHSLKDENPKLEEETLIGEMYDKYYKIHQSDLGHYFRNLYHIVKFVNLSQVKNKDEYTSLIRAQLSSHELLMLFYNSLSKYGTKFKPLIEQYHLLKNMPLDDLINPQHISLYQDSAFKK